MQLTNRLANSRSLIEVERSSVEKINGILKEKFEILNLKLRFVYPILTILSILLFLNM